MTSTQRTTGIRGLTNEAVRDLYWEAISADDRSYAGQILRSLSARMVGSLMTGTEFDAWLNTGSDGHR